MGWNVTVERDGGGILQISDQDMSGKAALSAADLEAIRTAGQHLVSFSGGCADVSAAAIRALSEKIVDDLMANPGGTADRLVLTSQGGRDMGGLARGPLVDRIEMLLRGEW